MDHGRKSRGADGTWVREGRPRCFVCVLVDPCGAVGLKTAQPGGVQYCGCVAKCLFSIGCLWCSRSLRRQPGVL